jgi:hypothetical protein
MKATSRKYLGTLSCSTAIIEDVFYNFICCAFPIVSIPTDIPCVKITKQARYNAVAVTSAELLLFQFLNSDFTNPTQLIPARELRQLEHTEETSKWRNAQDS